MKKSEKIQAISLIIYLIACVTTLALILVFRNNSSDSLANRLPLPRSDSARLSNFLCCRQELYSVPCAPCHLPKQADDCNAHRLSPYRSDDLS